MTWRGVVSTHELETGGLLAEQSGPACRLAQNAVAVGLADAIVLVQFGRQLHDDDAGDSGAPDRPTHGKLSRQQSGRIGRLPAG